MYKNLTIILTAPRYSPSHPNENIRRNDCAKTPAPPSPRNQTNKRQTARMQRVKNRPWLSLRAFPPTYLEDGGDAESGCERGAFSRRFQGLHHPFLVFGTCLSHLVTGHT